MTPRRRLLLILALSAALLAIGAGTALALQPGDSSLELLVGY